MHLEESCGRLPGGVPCPPGTQTGVNLPYIRHSKGNAEVTASGDTRNSAPCHPFSLALGQSAHTHRTVPSSGTSHLHGHSTSHTCSVQSIHGTCRAKARWPGQPELTQFCDEGTSVRLPEFCFFSNFSFALFSSISSIKNKYILHKILLHVSPPPSVPVLRDLDHMPATGERSIFPVHPAPEPLGGPILAHPAPEPLGGSVPAHPAPCVGILLSVFMITNYTKHYLQGGVVKWMAK